MGAGAEAGTGAGFWVGGGGGGGGWFLGGGGGRGEGFDEVDEVGVGVR